MKKLLFVLVFTFIGQQAFSQIYIVTLAHSSINGCDISTELTLTTVTNTGTETHTCIPLAISNGALISLNQELNLITGLGYKLIEINNGESNQNGTIGNTSLNVGTIFYLAMP